MRSPISFLKNLPDQPEHIKRRWVVILSAISMIIVVFLWTQYFGASLASIKQIDGPKHEVVENNDPGYLITVKNSVISTSKGLANALKSLGSIFIKSREYDIKP